MNYRILLSRHRSAIMGVAALMIVFFHSEWHGLPAYAVHLQRHMNVGVDIFVFLSGFGLVRALRQQPDFPSYYRRRMRRLLPACYAVILPMMAISVVCALHLGGINPLTWAMR